MKYKKLIICLVSILILIGITGYHACFVAPHKINIREETIYSNKIDSSLDDLIIAYFSDVHYGNFTSDDDVINMVEKINSINPDIVLFSGDLVDHYGYRGLNEDERSFLVDELSKIHASIGKYAVLGNHDSASENAIQDISNILIESDFSMLTNSNVQITNGNSGYFNLIGIDTLANGMPNIEQAYDGIDPTAYTFVFTHCPDIFSSLDKNITDYVVAGHSHGGQVYIPLFNYLYRTFGCNEYFKGKYHKSGTTLDITNGFGLTNKSIRLFADAEIVFYKLKTK